MLEPLCRIGPMRSANLALGPRFPPYLVLLRVGFTLPPASQPERCAFTAPFHPYPGAESWPDGRTLPAGSGKPPSLAARGVTGAVSFLWHWPSTGFKARVPDVIRHTALRSSDFPLPVTLACAKVSGSDRPVLLPVSSVPRIRFRIQQPGNVPPPRCRLATIKAACDPVPLSRPRRLRRSAPSPGGAGRTPPAGPHRQRSVAPRTPACAHPRPQCKPRQRPRIR